MRKKIGKLTPPACYNCQAPSTTLDFMDRPICAACYQALEGETPPLPIGPITTLE
ncbi:MAG: hypothetical protein H0T73_19485, partial [Ardenticatenales bacterium]|nr:hypothetical protein [Ardenticatenales bacterium]